MVMLRCVQVLRRLMVRNKDVGVFCNVSAATLGNPANFAQCLDFLEANRALAPSFVLEFKQATFRNLGPTETEHLAALCAARLPLLDRSRHRSADRAARTRRPRRPLHQGAGGAAARSQADLGLGHPSVRPVRSARPLRHRPDRRKDRGRARGGRPARLRRAVWPGLPVCAAPAVAARGGICYRRGDLEQGESSDLQWLQQHRFRSPARPSSPRCGRPAMPRWRAAPPDRANRRPTS